MLGEELTIIKLNTTEIRSSLWLKGRKEAVTPASIRVMKEHSGTEVAIRALWQEYRHGRS